MYSKAFLVALFSSVAFADLATIQTQLGNVNTALTSLDKTIQGIQSAADAAGLLQSTQALQTSLTGATMAITMTDPISVSDAVQLQATAGMLGNATTMVINDLISKKSVIDGAGADAVAVMNLQMQKTASMALVNAVISKVPQSVQSIAMMQTAGIGQTLDMAITTFGGTPMN